MDKGIRPACNAKFIELLPTRAETGDRVFRKNVIFYIVEEFGTTIASASTHYNYAFKLVKAANPELVVGLGRAEGKNNGGRKRKAATVASPMLLLGYDAPEAIEEVEMVEEQQQTFTVKRKSDNVVVAELLCFADAKAMIAKAAAAKKAKLYWV